MVCLMSVEPLPNSAFPKMAKGRVSDIVYEASSFDECLKWLLFSPESKFLTVVGR